MAELMAKFTIENICFGWSGRNRWEYSGDEIVARLGCWRLKGRESVLSSYGFSCILQWNDSF